jgi:hypothetical protein
MYLSKQNFEYFFLGRTRLEPIAIVVLSVIMCSASVEVIFESGQTLIQDVQYFIHRNNASSTDTLPDINMTTLPIVVMALTIGKLDFA